MTPPAPLRVVAAGLLVVGLAACGEDPPDTAVEDRLEALEGRVGDTTTEDELAARVDELETALAPLLADAEDDDAADPLTELGDAIDVLDDRVTALAETSVDADGAAAAATSASETAVADVRSSLDDVRSSTEAVRGEVDELRTLYETLRDRLDAQQRG